LSTPAPKGITMKKSVKIRFIIAAAALAAAGLATLAANLSTGFANFYSFKIYPAIQAVFSFISGLFPFSLAEFAVILLAVLLVGLIIYSLVRLGKIIIKREKIKRVPILSSLSTFALILSLIAFIFVFNCGINYYRSPFSAYSGLKIEKYTKEQVREVLEYSIEQVNSLISEIELDEKGLCVLPKNHLDEETAAMQRLADKYPEINAYYPHAKPVQILSPLWCYTKIVGMFVPFTMEANYNTCDTSESIGHNICHELSHLSGFMREDEANFISYLACIGSDSAYLKYSGYFASMNYLLNAYYPEVEYEEYVRVLSTLDSRAYFHICNSSDFWSKYDTPVAKVSSAVNDTYLKINNQSDGTKSYGRMVDLVIADYFQNVKEK